MDAPVETIVCQLEGFIIRTERLVLGLVPVSRRPSRGSLLAKIEAMQWKLLPLLAVEVIVLARSIGADDT